ncbi:glutamate 5-kinase [Defluviitalea raffinosedens]|uniref:Glutamate 5-kinase n=1 Tax=Defluviitalea raffinosedens TaxID=1450156 RepID=A0A7C8LIL2_9FIRM|nr:glutamate 5-kinase [Defluviitalea raffinosedens]KAE9636880.1 glutamate 5-kinase [Defluviitalea raffinosedens]MBM7686402.1 glutamate 5-kinase [Defluviitalea raffinosedens]HHW67188.1 glutamate 5-kinase [Candidatus Epulonipiscium sp.]
MDTRNELKNSKRIVIKIGTSSLTHPNGSLHYARMEQLARVLSDLRNSGKEVVLVSSGAIGVGAERLGCKERPKEVEMKQAAAAVGQAILMQIYEKFFSEYNQVIAQILLTKDVLEDSIKKINAQNTFNTLLKMGVIPIVNENDTVATEELQESIFGDNDTLSAMVAVLIEADLLILLSDIEGLYTQDPRDCPDAVLIDTVPEITDEIENLAGGVGSSLGTGGMITKISAAKIANNNGVNMVIANGENLTNIHRILEGEIVGTLFEKRTQE